MPELNILLQNVIGSWENPFKQISSEVLSLPHTPHSFIGPFTKPNKKSECSFLLYNKHDSRGN